MSEQPAGKGMTGLSVGTGAALGAGIGAAIGTAVGNIPIGVAALTAVAERILRAGSLAAA